MASLFFWILLDWTWFKLGVILDRNKIIKFSCIFTVAFEIGEVMSQMKHEDKQLEFVYITKLIF
jgi:hypothetical protein